MKHEEVALASWVYIYIYFLPSSLYLHVIVVIKGDCARMQQDEGKLCVRAYTGYYTIV